LLDRKLIATFLKSRDAWDTIRDKISDSAFEGNPFILKLLELVDEFYKKDDNATRIDLDILLQQIDLRVEHVKHKDAMVQLAKDLANSEVSVDNVLDLALEIKRKEIGDKLGLSILNGDDRDKQAKLMHEYTELLEASTLEEAEDEEEYNNVGVAEVVSRVVNPDALIKFAPKALNEALGGGALPGHHITYAARPESGKTAMMCTLMHGFALQELDGIYCGNEDPIMSVMQRSMSCITGMTKAEISADPVRTQDLLSRRGWNRLRFIPLNPGSLWEIEKYVKRYKPKWFIVDQMRNIAIKAGTKTEGLEQIAIGIRNIGKRYNSVPISITQAGDSASNKLVLEMGDIDSSNTGIPAACDAMVMIGVNAEYERQGMRMLALPKNKLGGNHNHFPVKLRADISRYETI
jgi:hypothetical protein